MRGPLVTNVAIKRALVSLSQATTAAAPQAAPSGLELPPVGETTMAPAPLGTLLD